MDVKHRCRTDWQLPVWPDSDRKALAAAWSELEQKGLGRFDQFRFGSLFSSEIEVVVSVWTVTL